MAIPTVGGGRQLGDGNLNELVLGTMPEPQTATATATLTAAQVTGNMIVANPSTSAATYTFPTASQIDAVLTNAKVGSTFDLVIVNLGTSSGALTLTMGTGLTLVGSATVAVTSSAILRFRKTADTPTYSVYRIE
jgi:hypothetical protein